jgi:L-threonylcarbamoyladenylate synthase
MTDRLPADGDGMRIAVETLRRGGLVAFPTDTVHGVACRGDDDGALARLFELKGRPAERRVAWLVSDLDQASTSASTCWSTTSAAAPSTSPSTAAVGRRARIGRWRGR